MAMIDVGATAPVFTLKNQDGEPVALVDFRGRWVVIYFYPEADTPVCTVQACSFNDELAAFKDLDLPVLAISPDQPPALAAFARKFKLGFTLLSDPPGKDGAPKVMAKYGVWGEKKLYGNIVIGVHRTTFLIDPAGRVAHRWTNVRTPGHGARVLETARKLAMT
ncbi:MAG: thioredoxin-dependent thiol peroxidase [Phycisphaerales bacterium]